MKHTGFSHIFWAAKLSYSFPVSIKSRFNMILFKATCFVVTFMSYFLMSFLSIIIQFSSSPMALLLISLVMRLPIFPALFIIYLMLLRGHQSVTTKRLKNWIKTTKLKEENVKLKGSGIDYLVVIDFEATCEKESPEGFQQEIIEFPAVLVNVEKREMVSSSISQILFNKFNSVLVLLIWMLKCDKILCKQIKLVHSMQKYPNMLQDVNNNSLFQISHIWNPQQTLSYSKKAIAAISIIFLKTPVFLCSDTHPIRFCLFCISFEFCWVCYSVLTQCLIIFMYHYVVSFIFIIRDTRAESNGGASSPSALKEQGQRGHKSPLMLSI